MHAPNTPSKLVSFQAFWNKFSFAQRISILILLVMIAVFPLLLLASSQKTDTRSRAAYYPPSITPITPPSPTSTPPINKISWTTPYVSLESYNFYIIGGGKKFFGIPDPGTTLSLRSDPPNPNNPNYTTLEAMWQENKTEMRLYIYLFKDNKYWWTPEMRTYNGEVQGKVQGNWISYTGRIFGSLIDNPYTANIFEIASDPYSINYINNKGIIHFENLKLQAFLNQNPSPTNIPAPVLCQVTPPADLSVSWISSYQSTLMWKPGSGGTKQLLRIGEDLNEVNSGCPGNPGTTPCAVKEDALSVDQNAYKSKVFTPGKLYYFRVVTYKDESCWKDALIRSTSPYILPPISTPSPASTPTPFPLPNNPPVITTTSLPVAKYNVLYNAAVSGSDGDLNDNLSMVISQLPKGLSQGPCSTPVDKRKGNYINCTITGKSQQRGIFSISVVLKDNRGSSTTKNLSLYSF